ncbi:MAG: hypothetical protein QOE38_1783, partial [Thermoleophilaceae bacterium]|nr:hypothetical protein [Thermoleophilaceae bacterium]
MARISLVVVAFAVALFALPGAASARPASAA